MATTFTTPFERFYVVAVVGENGFDLVATEHEVAAPAGIDGERDGLLRAAR